MEIGQRFNRLTIMQIQTETYDGKNNKGYPFCIAKCDCGTVKEFRRENLTRGLTNSCGCLQKEIASKASSTHGMTLTDTYYRWSSMKRRCQTPKDTAYPYYGAKGIKVCKRWQKFENFYEDMGDCNGLTLDRIDNKKGYFRSNCRWATRKEQARNRSSNNVLILNGKSKILTEWCEIYDMDYNTVERRINLLGWELEKALTTPKRKITKRIH